ncbi:hypothetical protein SY88_07300 [Clostridiales bacterium PH28_bin88]|nr:hypothetical protein SY88_07300 [Clostridiales bacterium PH28_bin88]
MSFQDPWLMADRAGATYCSEAGEFSLPYCGEEYRITFPTGLVRKGTGTDEVPVSDSTLLVLYLGSASGLPPRGRWLSFIELPGGPHHHAPFLQEAVYPVAKDFGRFPELLPVAASALGGKPAAFGKVGVVIPALPRIPLAVGVWPGDEEFLASAVILFDASAPTQLDTAALYVLGINTSRKLRARAQLK